MERKIVEAETITKGISIDDKLLVKAELEKIEKEKAELKRKQAMLEKEKENFEKLKEYDKSTMVKLTTFDLLTEGL